MKTLNIGSNRFTIVTIDDDSGAGGASHKYSVIEAGVSATGSASSKFASISFQNGPIGEHGVNGCHNEDLLAIVLHRLQCFQSGAFPCKENEMAILKIEEAIHWLNSRTRDRQKRGVEGKSEI